MRRIKRKASRSGEDDVKDVMREFKRSNKDERSLNGGENGRPREKLNGLGIEENDGFVEPLNKMKKKRQENIGKVEIKKVEGKEGESKESEGLDDDESDSAFQSPPTRLDD